jgi:hypothetical protein
MLMGTHASTGYTAIFQSSEDPLWAWAAPGNANATAMTAIDNQLRK